MHQVSSSGRFVVQREIITGHANDDDDAADGRRLERTACPSAAARRPPAGDVTGGKAARLGRTSGVFRRRRRASFVRRSSTLIRSGARGRLFSSSASDVLSLASVTFPASLKERACRFTHTCFCLGAPCCQVRLHPASVRHRHSAAVLMYSQYAARQVTLT